MHYLIVFLLFFLMPLQAASLTEKDKRSIADKLTESYGIKVTVAQKPFFSGDREPIIFQNHMSGNNFLDGLYYLPYTPNQDNQLGINTCNWVVDYISKRRELEADYLASFSIKLTASVSKILQFGVEVDEQTLGRMFLVALDLRDYMIKRDYGKFQLLFRGFADRGSSTFQGRIHDD